MARWIAVLIFGLGLLIGQVQSVHAQAVGGQVLQVGLDSIGRESVGMVGGIGGWYRQGHWVPVRVRLENRSGVRWSGYLAADQMDLDGDPIRCLSRPFVLEPTLGGRDLWLYYWPRPDDEDYWLRSVSVLDEHKQFVAAMPVEAKPQVILVSNTEDQHAQRWVVVLGPSLLGWNAYTGVKGGVATNRVSWVPRAEGLPDQALGLDGVDLLVWQAGQDAVVPSELGEDLRVRAILEWVKAGGHLIITTGPRWLELADPTHPLAAALPLDMRAAQQTPGLGLLNRYLPAAGFRGGAGRLTGDLIQVTGTLKPGARAVGPAQGAGRGEPLVVTGKYGQGAVTLATVDLAAPMFGSFTQAQWLAFWQQTAGWSGITGNAPALKSRGEYEALLAQPDFPLKGKEFTPVVQLDQGISASIDLTRQTGLRLLLAVVFLGLYWAAAGPGADLILRKKGRSTWSWWIFGASVVAASALALLMVWTFRIQGQELRHRTYVAGSVIVDNGSVGSPASTAAISIDAYYGLYLPCDGMMTVELGKVAGSGSVPAGGTAPGDAKGGQLAERGDNGGGGITYLVPFNEPTLTAIRGFADPQPYELLTESSTRLRIPFRSTLKKLQARWQGHSACRVVAHQVAAEFGRRSRPIGATESGKALAEELRPRPAVSLAGTLTNQTGYDLTQVRLVVLAAERKDWPMDGIFAVASWKNGQTVDLATLAPESAPLESVLMESSRAATELEHLPIGLNLTGVQKYKVDLLNALLELRGGESLTQTPIHTEFRRHFTRPADRSAAVRSSRMLILARAGSASGEGEAGHAAAPLPLVVNGRTLTGQGEIVFSWTLTLP